MKFKFTTLKYQNTMLLLEVFMKLMTLLFIALLSGCLYLGAYAIYLINTVSLI